MSSPYWIRQFEGLHFLSRQFRAPLEESRKWGIYNTTNLLFKTYFKVWISDLLAELWPQTNIYL